VPPKITIVTPSYNQGIFIDQTIRSVLSQGYENLEYIVIDGGSTDDSLSIINSYSSKISRIISEPDKGQSDAINKGFQLATGEILGWLNSDDILLPGSLNKVAGYFSQNPGCKWVAGNCIFTNIFLKPVWQYNVPQIKPEEYLKFWEGNYLSQPSVFFKKELFDEAGGVNIDLHYAMDLDLWLRFMAISPLHVINAGLSINRTYPNTKTSTGKETAIDEIAGIIFNSSLNNKQGFTLPFIKSALRKYFLASEKNTFRSELYNTFKSVSGYKLSLLNKLQLMAIVIKRSIVQIIFNK
jgi:glycosyltransferase involved in cell wall biosynthesis